MFSFKFNEGEKFSVVFRNKKKERAVYEVEKVDRLTTDPIELNFLQDGEFSFWVDNKYAGGFERCKNRVSFQLSPIDVDQTEMKEAGVSVWQVIGRRKEGNRIRKVILGTLVEHLKESL